MAPAQKAIIEDWGKWVFRGIITILLVGIWSEAKEVKQDVKGLMEERGSMQLRVGRAEKDIDQLQNASTNLWNRLIEHELKNTK